MIPLIISLCDLEIGRKLHQKGNNRSLNNLCISLSYLIVDRDIT